MKHIKILDVDQPYSQLISRGYLCHYSCWKGTKSVGQPIAIRAGSAIMEGQAAEVARLAGVGANIKHFGKIFCLAGLREIVYIYDNQEDIKSVERIDEILTIKNGDYLYCFDWYQPLSKPYWSDSKKMLTQKEFNELSKYLLERKPFVDICY